MGAVAPKAYKHCNCELSQDSYHHHHQATVQLCHMLPRSGLTNPEDSSVVFPGSCYLWPVGFYYPWPAVQRHSVDASQTVPSVAPYFVKDWTVT